MIPAALALCVGTPGDGVGGWGCVEPAAGWRVVSLHGTDRRIGELYGQLLRDELLGAWVPMNEEMHYHRLPRVFRAIFLRQQRRFPDYFDARTSARIAGLDAALDLAPGTTGRYAWLADLGSFGPALQLALAGTVQLDAETGRISSRCTTVIGHDGGSTVHARNLDWWGMGWWQPHATLVVVEPLDASGRPDGLRYAHVGTLGEHLAGTTGVNEAGLVVTTHLHVTRDATLSDGRLRVGTSTLLWEGLAERADRPGVGIHTLVENVLRDARTVGEAVAYLESHPPVGAWSFALSDPAGARAVVGVDPRGAHTTWDASVNTNFYLDPAHHLRELHPSRGPVEGARLRYARAEALLGDGEIGVPGAVAILRDRFDSAVGLDRPVSPNSVLSPDTSQSVVVVTRPGELPVLWLATPFSDGYTPAALGSFVEVSFDGRPTGRELAADPADRRVLDAYLAAMARAIDARDPEGAAALLRAIDTDDPGIRLMAAWASAAVDADDAARAELVRFDASGASHHHRVLAFLLAGELARRAGEAAAARAAFEAGLAEATSDPGPWAPLDANLAAVLRDRLARAEKRPKEDLPFPDLKFQDVIPLRLEGRAMSADGD